MEKRKQISPKGTQCVCNAAGSSETALCCLELCTSPMTSGYSSRSQKRVFVQHSQIHSY